MQFYQVLKTKVHATSYDDASEQIIAWIKAAKSCYVVAANVHVIMTAYGNAAYQQVIDRSELVTPDGMPLVWALRLLGARHQTRVYGPDLMLFWCNLTSKLGFSVYFYGTTTPVLENLTKNLSQKFPNLKIAGYFAPPFGENSELEADLRRIQAAGANVVFVGLGCPKQEFWMAQAQGKITAVMIGVGAAFDFHGGQVAQAPRWMMGLGLEWIFRLFQEPRRLWRRYLINNPSFVILFFSQLVALNFALSAQFLKNLLAKFLGKN